MAARYTRLPSAPATGRPPTLLLSPHDSLV